MTNLFPFEYIEQTLKNQDGSDSNFRQVFGLKGKNILCPKSSYHMIKTEDVSQLGHAFIGKGYNVEPWSHRNGEVVGLTIKFGDRPTKVGEMQYKLIITIPNNGNGRGYLSIKQLRLICTNGMVSNKTMHKDNYIKIPHTIDYKQSLVLMEKSLGSYLNLLEQVESRDEAMAGAVLKDTEVMYHLNKWFFEKELPSTQKKITNDEGEVRPMTLKDFRKMLVVNPELIPSKARYDELQEALKKELGYNKQLDLDLSMYTVFATVTNYLSRRVEKSGAKAPQEIKDERASAKLSYFDDVVAQLS